MIWLNRFAIGSAIAALAGISATAQQPAAPAAPPTTPYGPPITLAQAKQAMAAAEAEAMKNGWPLAIAIVDSGGNLVMLHKLDNTQYGSIRIAEGKARTALDFRRSTKAFEDTVAAGGAGLRLLTFGITVAEGGPAHHRRRQDRRSHRCLWGSLLSGRAGGQGGGGRCQIKAIAAAPCLDYPGWYNWIRLPQVSAHTAMVTGPVRVGSCVKATPSPFSLPNSFRMSSTSKAAIGMPCLNIAS